jgi:phospholipase C
MVGNVHRTSIRAFCASLAAISLFSSTACSGPKAGTTSVVPQAETAFAAPHTSMPIKHIVIIVQENRTFDNFFATYPGADGASVGKTIEGKTVKLQPIGFKAALIDHLWRNAMNDWDNGKLDGFDIETPTENNRDRLPLRPDYAYAYVKPYLVAPYWAMAQQYVLADRFFQSEFGPSFIGHQTLIRGTTAISATRSVMDEPNGQNECDAPAGATTNVVNEKRIYLAFAGPFPCFNAATIADSLDSRGITWKYYNQVAVNSSLSSWDAFLAIHSVRFGPDFANVSYVPNQILVDAKAGNLPGVSWVIPGFLNSDHAENGSDTGPSWVASIVNAIGKGPQWGSTAIIVVWDDSGGWYDHVPPPQLDYLGLGFRVPCLIVSPYAKKGVILHSTYEMASVLKTVEQVFSLASIGTRDVRARGLLDAFDFSQPERAFTPIAAKYSTDFFLRQPPSNHAVDDD